MKDDKQSKISELEAIAQEIIALKNKIPTRRPIIIEFCGMPKSGKTTCINALDIFLRRNMIRSTVVTERASMCAISNKFDPAFNLWNLFSMSCELLRLKQLNSHDVIILDRGIFDAACWLEWQAKQRYLRKSEKDRFINFLDTDSMRGLVDLVCIFTVDEDESIRREHSSLLTNKKGSIMRREILSEFKRSVIETKDSFGKSFIKLINIDTTSMQESDSCYKTTKAALSELNDLLVEKVGYLSASDNICAGNFKHVQQDFYDSLPKIKFQKRPQVESNDLYIQPIPVAVLKDKYSNRLIIGQKKDDVVGKNGPEFRKQIVYFGGHTRAEDAKIDDNNYICERALEREINEELGIALSLEESMPSLIINLKDNPTSKKHLAIVYIIEIDFSTTKIKPNEIELSLDSKTKSGEVYDFDTSEKEYNFCSWSKLILKELFSVDTEKQISLEF